MALPLDKLNKLLVEYGHAEYTTDPSQYHDETIREQHGHAKAA